MSAYKYAVFLIHCDNKEIQETKQINIDPKVLEIEDVATSALYLAKLVCAFSTEKT